MSARMNQSDGREQMNQHTEQYQQENPSNPNQSNNNKGAVGEYIDFEEIKDWDFPIFALRSKTALDP